MIRKRRENNLEWIVKLLSTNKQISTELNQKLAQLTVLEFDSNRDIERFGLVIKREKGFGGKDNSFNFFGKINLINLPYLGQQ